MDRRHDDRYGVGFIGITTTSSSHPPTTVDHTATSPAACVWDRAVICHERQAWIHHVLANTERPDLDRYLTDLLEGEICMNCEASATTDSPSCHAIVPPPLSTPVGDARELPPRRPTGVRNRRTAYQGSRRRDRGRQGLRSSQCRPRGTLRSTDHRRPGWLSANAMERQHIEILQAAASRDALRAEAVLRDHTAEFGCDPIAVLAVATSLGSSADERLSDPRSASCSRLWTRSDFRSP